MRSIYFRGAALFLILVMAGCAGNNKLIKQKNTRITGLEERVDSLKTELRKNREEKRSIQTELRKKLGEAREDLKVCMEKKEDLLKIKITDAIKFEFGHASLTRSGKEAIDSIWEVLQRHSGRRVLIEGHTDDVSIDENYTHIYRSNWELSAARANAVLRYLIEKHGADPDRLTVSGYGEYQPMADNDTPEGRAENRRVVISVRDTVE